jgi:hypothetical protein
VDEVIVKFEGDVILQQYLPKKNIKRFDIKIYKLCGRSGYTYNMKMKVYLGKQRNVTSTDVTPKHGFFFYVGWDLRHQVLQPLLAYCTAPDDR